MKVIVAEANYKEYNRVLVKSSVGADAPTLFMKPDSSILKDGKPFFIPDFLGEIEYGVHFAAKVCRLGKSIPERFAYRYYDELTIGVDFRAGGLLNECVADGLPWDLATGFDSSAIIGKFKIKPEDTIAHNMKFRLDVDGDTKQMGNTCDMIHTIDHIISYLSESYTLKIGDLIFSGIPGVMTKAVIDQHIEGYLNDEKLLDFHIR